MAIGWVTPSPLVLQSRLAGNEPEQRGTWTLTMSICARWRSAAAMAPPVLAAASSFATPSAITAASSTAALTWEGACNLRYAISCCYTAKFRDGP